MRPARLLICLLVVSGGLGAAFLLVPRAVSSLRSLTVPALTLPRTTPPSHHTEPQFRHRHDPARAYDVTDRRDSQSASARLTGYPRRDGSRSPLELVAIELAGAVVTIGAIALLLALRRARRRRTRTYALYELHLSTHDQAKAQDLEDMIEQVANIVRVWPAERLRNGQPYVALELICGVASANLGRLEMEWSINIRCEPKTVSALDGAISAAYPDVRLGRTHGEQPLPRPGVLREPGFVMRFRKERSFVYSLIAGGRGRLRRRSSRSHAPRSRLRRPRSFASSSRRRRRTSRRSRGACTAVTRTGLSARNAGDCLKAA